MPTQHLVAYPNGAVAPAKTPSVAAAEAAHFAAKGALPINALAYNGAYPYAYNGAYAGLPYAAGAYAGYPYAGAYGRIDTHCPVPSIILFTMWSLCGHYVVTMLSLCGHYVVTM